MCAETCIWRTDQMAGRDAPAPWGRFKLVSKEPAEDSDHIYLTKTSTKIGRLRSKSDAVIDKAFVSGVHCIVTLQGRAANGAPIVMMEDLSRNGIYVNEERVGQARSVILQPNVTIHFVRPGLTNQEPLAFRYEVLNDGLTPENERRRVEADQLAMASSRSSTARSRSTTPSLSRTTTPIPPTGHVISAKRKVRSGDDVDEGSGKRKKRGGHGAEEMEVDWTRSVSGSTVDGSPSSASAKRRRVIPIMEGDNDGLLTTAETLRASNEELRQKVGELNEKEVKLKHDLSLALREADDLRDQLQALDENKKMMESELALKSQRLSDREQEVDRVRQEKSVVENEVERLRLEVTQAVSEAKRHADIATLVSAQCEKLRSEMSTMTTHYESSQSRARALDDKLKELRMESTRLKLFVDSAHTRSEQVEEGKRGIHEENRLLRDRLNALQNVFNAVDTASARGKRLLKFQADQSIIATELEALKGSDHSILSSEHSQPAPTQESYYPETQQEEEDEETQDPEAVGAETGTIVTTGLGPFGGQSTKLTLEHSISSDLMNLSDQQQPHSTDISQDETPAGYTDGKSSQSLSNSENSTFSSHSSASKTPPAPPPPRPRIMAEAKATTSSQESEETKGEAPTPSVTTNTTVEGSITSETKLEGKADADETVLSEGGDGDDEGDDEDDKENTPVKPDSVPALDAKPPSQKPGHDGWLQMVVNNDDDKSDQISTSEGGGVFDEETQLSSE